jgi:hypothetical protein
MPVIDLYPLRGNASGTMAPPILPGGKIAPESRQSPLAYNNVPAPSAAPGGRMQAQYGQQRDIPASEVPFFAQAVGFGNDIPLALAAGQIIPAEFPYAFSESIDPGIKINWSGGKPWNETLQDALAPYGLGFVISDTGVMIVPGHSAPPVASAPMPYGSNIPSQPALSYPPENPAAGNNAFMTPVPLVPGV